MKKINPIVAIVICVAALTALLFSLRWVNRAPDDVPNVTTEIAKPPPGLKTFKAPPGEHILTKGGRVDLPSPGVAAGQ